MNDRILILTTGGAIGSILGEGQLTRDVHPGGDDLKAVIQNVAQSRKLAVTVRPVINILSENAQPEDWLSLLRTVDEAYQEGFRRIVITHGTDTFAYSAAMLGQMDNRPDLKIVLTASFYGLDEAVSDAPLNIEAALTAVSSNELPADVYTAVRRPDDPRLPGTKTKAVAADIIRAMDLLPMQPNDNGFTAVFGRRYAEYLQHTRTLSLTSAARLDLPGFFRPLQLGGPLPDAIGDVVRRRIFMIEAAPGFCLSMLRFPADEDCVLLVKLYHSGTAPAIEYDGSLLEFMRTHPRVTVIMATLPHIYVAYPYESTAKLIRAGAVVVFNWLPHQLYVRFLLGLAQGRKVDELVEGIREQVITLPSVM